jgi:hypothetical protein
MVLTHSGVLSRSSNRLYSTVGGLSFALTLSSLFAGISGQHFYPQEQTLGIWAAFFLALRIYVEEKRARMGTIHTDGWWEAQSPAPAAAAATVVTGETTIDD